VPVCTTVRTVLMNCGSAKFWAIKISC
jgi:hypothetical protein